MRGASAAENAATQPAKIYFCGEIFLDILSKNNSNPNTDPNPTVTALNLTLTDPHDANL